jgi:hypothetical protein
MYGRRSVNGLGTALSDNHVAMGQIIITERLHSGNGTIFVTWCVDNGIGTARINKKPVLLQRMSKP